MTVVALQAPTKVPAPRKAKKSKKHVAMQWHKVAAANCMVGTVGLMGLSLCHLGHGFELISGGSMLSSYLFAFGIDYSYVAVEQAKIACDDKLRKTLGSWFNVMIWSLIAVSSALNALAFAWDATGIMVYPAAFAGGIIPLMIYGLQHIASTMWIKK